MSVGSNTVRFDGFSVGDYVTFTKRFTPGDFSAFSMLSGDKNPLHHDLVYAKDSEFGQPIVPLHLLAAPLSAIAGMMLPGDPSLYLEHNIRAVKSVFYDEELIYSAKVIAVSPATRVLTLSVIVFRKLEIVLDGDMIVTARVSEWQDTGKEKVYSSNNKKRVLITGASGAIGSAVARALAADGHDLLVHYNNGEGAVGELADHCRKHDIDVQIVKSALDTQAGISMFLKKISVFDDLSNVIHTASPPLDSKLDALIEVNYCAYKAIVNSILPMFLRCQSGVFLFIGSTVLNHAPFGWEAYAGAKAMTQSINTMVERNFGRYGVRGLTIAPGYVQSKFSEGHRSSNDVALLPEEVADVIVSRLREPSDKTPYLEMEVGFRREGYFGFHDAIMNEQGSLHREGYDIPIQSPELNMLSPVEADSLRRREIQLENIVRSVLELPVNRDVTNASMNTVSNWDSLRHIKLMIEIERAFGVKFTSNEIAVTYSYEGLKSLVTAN